MKVGDKINKLLSVIESNKVLQEEYEKENLDVYIDEKTRIPYITYGEYNHIHSQMTNEEYKNWKSKLSYHFKKSNLVFDNETNSSYTLKEFL